MSAQQQSTESSLPENKSATDLDEKGPKESKSDKLPPATEPDIADPTEAVEIEMNLLNCLTGKQSIQYWINYLFEEN